jgi:cytidine deaminase
MNKEHQSLIEAAREVRKFAYVPYSHYPVGAALLAASGKVYTGVNVENAAFPVTNCAERTAIFKAVSDGERKFKVLALVTDNGGSPCGSCRQVLAEFGLETLILIADGEGRLVKQMTVAELLPMAFTPEHLDSQ